MAAPRSDLVNVAKAVTSSTASRASPVEAADKETLPGIATSAMLDVMAATNTDANLLRRV